jgi:hypothetical protein
VFYFFAVGPFKNGFSVVSAGLSSSKGSVTTFITVNKGKVKSAQNMIYSYKITGQIYKSL